MAHQSLQLGKYSIEMGDRFAHQAKAQLQACLLAEKDGVVIEPVWNKSNREHAIIGSKPSSVRQAADTAVAALGWKHAYYCDADHINLPTVRRFLGACDFYTIDVADFIGHALPAAEIDAFVARHSELLGRIRLDGAAEDFEITTEILGQAARIRHYRVRWENSGTTECPSPASRPQAPAHVSRRRCPPGRGAFPTAR